MAAPPTNGYGGRGIGVGRGFVPRGGGPPFMDMVGHGRGRGRFIMTGVNSPGPAPTPYHRGPLREPVNKNYGRSSGELLVILFYIVL